jgi:trypsin
MKAQHTKSSLTFLLGLGLASPSPSHFAFARASSSDLDLALTSTPNLRQHTRTLIINGDRAEPGRYNYFVSLQDELLGPSWGPMCGGSLIAADVVLTAAHCGSDFNLAVIKRHDLGDISDGIAIPIEEYLPHPDYNLTSFLDNDFMLLFLNNTAPQDAAFVKLNRDPNVPAANDFVTVMGHGDTVIGDVVETSMDLLEVEVNVVSNEECAQSWFLNANITDNMQELISWEDLISDNMLCTKDTDTDKGGCQGDSGGPLVIKGKDVHGSDDDVQVGVVSWGNTDCETHIPGVYSRVSSAFEWIRQEVCARSMYPPADFNCESIISIPTSTQREYDPSSTSTSTYGDGADLGEQTSSSSSLSTLSMLSSLSTLSIVISVFLVL